MAYVAKTAIAPDDVYAPDFASPLIYVLEKIVVNFAQMDQVKFAIYWVLRKFEKANGCEVAFVLIEQILIRYPSFVFEYRSAKDAIDVIRVVALHILP